MHVQHHYHYHGRQDSTSINQYFHLNDLKMAEIYSKILGRHVDPSTPLSNLDIVKITLYNIDERVNEERDHNKNVVFHQCLYCH